MQISGEIGWTQQSFTLPSGPQVVRWQYAKDPSGSAGQDTGWVDQVKVPQTAPTFAFTQPVRRADGYFQLTLTGVVSGVSYRILSSSNLSDWSAFATVTAYGNTTQLLDQGAANVPLRYYRAVTP
jgi:hypothetical protein